jgi:hypothetical protein
MDSKKLLSVENLILYAGVGFLAYWYFRKTPKAITIDPPLQSSKDEPKTIVLDLRDTKGNGRRNIFSNNLAKDYNSSERKTFAPARTVITETNDL